MRVIGLMSGTSLDGIDVAAVDVRHAAGERLIAQPRHFLTVPFGPSLLATLERSLPPHDAVASCVAELNVALGEAFASAVLQAASRWKLDLGDVDLIGSHGLTLYHAPQDGVTMQIGEPSIIAARTGVTCVADFRPADVAAGGQGAPLVPFVDRALFSDEREHRAVVNIGGIANVTLLSPGADGAPASAFDTGPGNMLIDACVRLATNGAERFDRDGCMASRGNVAEALLDELRSDAYFGQDGPKSTGRERFGADYAASVWKRGIERGCSPNDIIATATMLTAATIAAAVPARCSRLIVSGGGAHNRTLLAMLAAALPSVRIETSDAYGVGVDEKEAVAFALLAFEAIAGRPNHLPGCTGARSRAVLGKIVPGANYQSLMRGLWDARARTVT